MDNAMDKKKTLDLELIHIDDFNPPYPEWWIKNIIPKKGICVLYGRAGAGKSFLALDMAVAFIKGGRWYDHRVEQTGVYYIAAEGAGSLSGRIKAYKKEYPGVLDGARFYINSKGMGRYELVPYFKALAKRIKELGGIGFIVVDTLASMAPGMEENSSTDMSRFLATVKGLRDDTGATVLVVHHSGIHDGVDTSIEVVRDEEDDTKRQFYIRKQRDGPDRVSINIQNLPSVNT